MKWRDWRVLACLAPRNCGRGRFIGVRPGAASLLAAEGASPQLIAQAQLLAPVTFLVILATVACYGLAAAPLARALAGWPMPTRRESCSRARIPGCGLALTVKNCGFPVVLVDTNFRNVSEARMAGLTAECARILSEHVQEEIDLSGIGRLVALTPNDEVNALAIRELGTSSAGPTCISWSAPQRGFSAAASRCPRTPAGPAGVRPVV